LLTTLLVLAAACAEPALSRPPDRAAPLGGGQAEAEPTQGSVELTVLYTSDEHGWILPRIEQGTRRGGVAQLLAQLVEHEGHCAGPTVTAAPEAAAVGTGARISTEDRCAHASTVLLSGGDNHVGPAISGHFRGESMARAMARLGYAASAFGNHELDYGRPQFFANQRRARLPYLAANVVRPDGGPVDLGEPFIVVERAGVKLGVIGLATPDTPRISRASRYAGLIFEDFETALERAVPQAWDAGIDALVVVVHDCHDRVQPIVEQHPEWHLSFVGTGHCHQTHVELAAGAAVITPGWRMDHYGRVELRIQRHGPPRERAELVSQGLVEVASPSGQPAPSVDPAFDAQIAAWQREIDRALGEVIGHSATGLPRSSPLLGQWVVVPWRERLKADVALTSSGSIRQDLPAGPISLATVHSILPFENELVVGRVRGETLLEMLRSPRAVVAGARRLGDGSFQLSDGRPLEPGKRYSVATTDYLFFGGDGSRFAEDDPSPERTGQSWRQPVIDWTRAQASSSARPLERVLSQLEP